MKLASVLTPLSHTNMRRAAQCGVEGVVIRYPGPSLEALLSAKKIPEAYGLRVFAVDGYLPNERIKIGPDGDSHDLATTQQLIPDGPGLGTAFLPCFFNLGENRVRRSKAS